MIAFVPMAAAQGQGQGQRRVTIEFTEPETAAKNRTVDLKDGKAEAKFRVGYQRTGGGGGGPMGGAGFLQVCQPGTTMNIKLKAEPVPEGAQIEIVPPTATYQIGQQIPPPVPPTGGGRVYTQHTVTVHWAVANLTKPTKVEFNLTHEAGTIAGGQCLPSAPNTGNMPAKASLNLTLPFSPPVIKPKAVAKEDGFLPGPGFVVVLLGLALVLALGRRARN